MSTKLTLDSLHSLSSVALLVLAVMTSATHWISSIFTGMPNEVRISKTTFGVIS